MNLVSITAFKWSQRLHFSVIRNWVLLIFVCSAFAKAYSQQSLTTADTTVRTIHTLTFKAYADGYFSAYSNDLPQSEFQPFETAGARDNTIGLNVGQIGLSYEHDRVRANVTFHFGDIPQATWSQDYNEVQEANAGMRLADGLWLDAGFFATHIGTESFLPKNNFLSNTAFKTFNEPFYQAGARLSYDKVKDWYFELWALNGYNLFLDNNDAKSVGALVKYSFNENSSITYTNIYGRESPDDVVLNQYRFYQNIYCNQNWADRWFLVLGFDLGLQTNSELLDPNDGATMFAALATLRYQISKEWSITGRGEVFNDPDGFIGGTFQRLDGSLTGFELIGLSLGTEYRPVEGSYLRGETRYTSAGSDQLIFNQNGRPENTRWEVLFTLGLDVEKAFQF
jgi:hypothetical protein